MTPVDEPKNAIPNSVEVSGTPTREEVLIQCNRIISSEDFRNALSQQKLLRHLVEETLEGRGSDLKEYSVGMEVFQRTQDFDPRTDAIVRVSVGQLRRRLSVYYSAGGAGDSVVIQIPKGHYSAEFGFLEVASVAESIATPVLMKEPEVLKASRGVAGWTSRQRWVLGLILVVAMVLASLGTWLAMRKNEVPRSTTAIDMQKSLFWSTFLQGDTKAIAVIGLATSATIGPVVVRSSDDNNDQAMENDPNIQKIASLFKQPIKPFSVYTGIGEAMAAGCIQHAFTGSSLELSMLPAQEVRFLDLHGANVIFLSSLHFRDIRRSLSDKRDFDTVETAPYGIQVLNHAPKAGEQAMYPISGDYIKPSVDYALVSILPGTEPSRRILEIGGTGTLGTAGAAQFLTERQSLSGLDAKLKRDWPGKPMSLQVLLRVDIVDHQVVSVHYVTHHWIR